ncbi:MAG: 50S ribosomal protein L4 [Dehalococcoidia bacterium]
MQIPVKNRAGKPVGEIEINDKVFGVPMNAAVVHQALVRQRANARQGTADTKTRGEVIGSRRKLHPQKHTGRARAGNIGSPLRRGGGVAFGPHPRSYTQQMPKKMRRLALKCVLSSKASENRLSVIQNLNLKEVKTKEIAHMLEALEAKPSALIVTSETDRNIVKSAANLPRVKTLPAPLLNVVDLLSHRHLIMTVDAVRRAEEIWGTNGSVKNQKAISKR